MLHHIIMRTFLQLCCGILAVFVLLCHSLRAQDTTRIEINHATGTMKVNGEPLSSDTVRASTSKAIKVTVINTNTALYDYKMTGEKIEVKEVAGIQEFLKVLGPYLVDVPSKSIIPMSTPDTTGVAAEIAALTAKTRRSAADDARLRALEERLRVAELAAGEDPVLVKLRGDALALQTELKALNELLVGNDGIVLTRSAVLAALGRMAVGDPIATVLAGVSARLTPLCRRRGLSNGLLARFSPLYQRVVDFEAVFTPNAGKLSKQDSAAFKDVLDKGRAAINDFDRNLTAAYATEALGTSMLDARDTLTLTRAPGVATTAGRALNVAITQKKASELARIAKPDTTYAMALMPKWTVRTSVGLALLYTRAAAFPTYHADKAGDVYTISELSAVGQDLRFNYGLVLSLSVVNDEDDELGPAIWLPEITVNPTDGVKFVGVGLGVSWNVFKLGAGYVWTRRKVLDGKSIGETITDANVPLRDNYSVGQVYVSLSVIGWQPFVK